MIILFPLLLLIFYGTLVGHLNEQTTFRVFIWDLANSKRSFLMELIINTLEGIFKYAYIKKTFEKVRKIKENS